MGPANTFTVISGLTDNPDSGVKLQSGNISASLAQVRLRFDGALDGKSASNVSRYSVEVNGTYVKINGARYEGGTQSVILQLQDGSLQTGDEVVASWNSLKDAQGLNLSGHSNDLNAR